jgi:hypothetical protein
VDECPRNPHQIMATAAQFDLNRALQHWLARLGQSPQVKAENLTELESHVRDSVTQLQSKGLSSEESFLVATLRVGSPEKLEPEFAKVNQNPLNLIIHGLILAFFSIGCWFLWGLLHFPQMVTSATRGMALPAFTRLAVDCGSYLAVPPLLAAAYCGYVWLLKTKGQSFWMGFFATTMATLVLLTLPTLIAVLLPVIAFMQNQPIVK